MRAIALLVLATSCGRSIALPAGRHLPERRTYAPLFSVDRDAATATGASIYGLWERPGARLILRPGRYTAAIACGALETDIIGVSLPAHIDAKHIETLDRAWQSTGECKLEVVAFDIPACARPADKQCFVWNATSLEFRGKQTTAYTKILDDVSSLPE